ncbi:MAG TPA: hypothetical protein IAA04_12900 [Candidatus Lachnoclostridium pullistercoris]|uniref:Uncharacterized protein n=1 Tax=Candidatus Lachnoclostridium pullistercoris TaxID=2838632 RepID=A0A9D2PDT6_9FIRM|nr:hypothetical protein [Candidatus Lachnoclostridium pullistercoris]
MQGRRLLKMARKNIAEIVQPEIEKQGFKIGEIDPNGDMRKEIAGYRFDSEESFRDQLKFLLNLTLEKGIPKMNELIAKEQVNNAEK